jgi:hypothetical protein
MEMRWTLLTSLLIFLLVFSALGVDPPTSYREASDIAKDQDNDPAIKAYLKDSFNPQYQRDYGPVFVSCFKTVAEPDDRPFAFVAEINSDGRVGNMYVDRTSNIYLCFREAFVKGQFVAPPKSPVYVDIDMQFRMPRQ